MNFQIFFFVISLISSARILEDGKDKFDPVQFCVEQKDSKCLECAESRVNDGVCTQPKEKIKNCLEYNSDDDTLCKLCQFRYQLSEDSKSCELLKNLCAIEEDGKCVACMPKYKLSEDNRCVETHAAPVVENCKVYISKEIEDKDGMKTTKAETKCLLCEDDYSILNEGCVKTGLNCFVVSEKAKQQDEGEDNNDQSQQSENDEDKQRILAEGDEYTCETCNFKFYMDDKKTCIKSTQATMTLMSINIIPCIVAIFLAVFN